MSDEATTPARESVRQRVLVTATELAELAAGAQPPVLLDVRWALGDSSGHEKYLEGHLPGARYVDLDSQLASHGAPTDGRHPLPSLAVLQGAARSFGISADSSVVLYDDSGGLAAARGWWLLRWAGLARVRLLDGGLAAWKAASLPIKTGEARAVPPGDVVLSGGHLATVDADGVPALAAGGVLLDARAGERYRGEVEPIDPRAGHIPGAVSAPTTDVLTPEGAFRPAEQLRAHFAGLGVTPGAGTVGVYCGSGVTASHEIAALACIGIDAVLFPGSFSAWSSDPARSVVTGETPAGDR